MIKSILLQTLFVITTSAFANPTLTTLAGTGKPGYSGDNAPAQAAQLNNPYGLTKGPDDALFICDVDNHIIRRVDKTGHITTIAGTPTKKGYAGDNGPATAALMNEPYEARFDKSGNLYVVERMNHVVRKIDAKTQIITTIAGTGKPGFAGDNGPAKNAQFNQPHALQFDPAGDLYICDIANHRIRKINMKTQTIQTFAGTGAKKPTPDNAPLQNTPRAGPRAIDFDQNGDAYIALREGNALYKIEMKTKTLHHIAGTGKPGFTTQTAPANSSPLNGPKGISIAPNGNIYLADTESHSIRMINPKTQTIEQIAGTGQKGDGPEGNPLKCKLTRPHGIFIDKVGTIYIGDSESHRVMVIRTE
jgi:streptogramin lyase